MLPEYDLCPFVGLDQRLLCVAPGSICGRQGVLVAGSTHSTEGGLQLLCAWLSDLLRLLQTRPRAGHAVRAREQRQSAQCHGVPQCGGRQARAGPGGPKPGGEVGPGTEGSGCLRPVQEGLSLRRGHEGRPRPDTAPDQQSSDLSPGPAGLSGRGCAAILDVTKHQLCTEWVRQVPSAARYPTDCVIWSKLLNC